MSYSREEVKAITDKVLNMAKADAVEVRFSGGERSATRYASSTITANLVEHDQEVLITVYFGQKLATTSTHQFDQASLKSAIEQAQELAKHRPDNREPRRARSGSAHHRLLRPEVGDNVDPSVRRSVAEVGDRAGAGAREASARQPRTDAAREAAAGLPDGRQCAAGGDRVRSGGARPHGEAEHRRLREERRARLRLHPEDALD